MENQGQIEKFENSWKYDILMRNRDKCISLEIEESKSEVSGKNSKSNEMKKKNEKQ